MDLMTFATAYTAKWNAAGKRRMQATGFGSRSPATQPPPLFCPAARYKMLQREKLAFNTTVEEKGL